MNEKVKQKMKSCERILFTTEQRSMQGFTLLEILIALTIFAILTTMTSTVIYHAFHTRTRLNLQMERLSALQRAIIQLERDTQQIIERSVRMGDIAKILPSFQGEPQYIEFTHNGMTNPHSYKKQSTLERVAFLCRNNQLIRRHWLTLDTTAPEQYHDYLLIDNLKSCQFAYLNYNLHVLHEWHENAEAKNQKNEPFPKAIQLNLVLADWGEMSYLFIIPSSL